MTQVGSAVDHRCESVSLTGPRIQPNHHTSESVELGSLDSTTRVVCSSAPSRFTGLRLHLVSFGSFPSYRRLRSLAACSSDPVRWWSPRRQRVPTPGNANMASEVPTKLRKNDDAAAASASARAAWVAAGALFATTRARTNRASGQLGIRSRIRGSPSRPRKV